jgi:hypothetical protein
VASLPVFRIIVFQLKKALTVKSLGRSATQSRYGDAYTLPSIKHKTFFVAMTQRIETVLTKHHPI